MNEVVLCVFTADKGRGIIGRHTVKTIFLVHHQHLPLMMACSLLYYNWESGCSATSVTETQLNQVIARLLEAAASKTAHHRDTCVETIDGIGKKGTT